jgi:hypothetical protein
MSDLSEPLSHRGPSAWPHQVNARDHRPAASSPEVPVATSLAASVSQGMLVNDLPDVTPAEVAGALGYLERSVAAMPDVTRVGVGIASTVVGLGLGLVSRSPFRRLALDRRATLAGRLAGVSLPVVTEFVQLTRGLALVGVYEQRTAALVGPREGEQA